MLFLAKNLEKADLVCSVTVTDSVEGKGLYIFRPPSAVNALVISFLFSPSVLVTLCLVSPLFFSDPPVRHLLFFLPISFDLLLPFFKVHHHGTTSPPLISVFHF